MSYRSPEINVLDKKLAQAFLVLALVLKKGISTQLEWSGLAFLITFHYFSNAP